MDSFEIGKILQNLPEFEGVYAIDTLPNSLRKIPSAYVINSDRASGPGIHWISLYVDERNHAYLFDSYGNSPVFYGLDTYLNDNCKSWSFNRNILQSPLTSICGAYCVYFVMMKNADVKEWLQPFTDNVILNDCIVLDFVWRFLRDL
jgi:hypothetical protein